VVVAGFTLGCEGLPQDQTEGAQGSDEAATTESETYATETSGASQWSGGGTSTVLPGDQMGRIARAFTIRAKTATLDALVGPGINITNGDNDRYHDKCATYTKGLPHDSYGRVNLGAYSALSKALKSGKFADFEKIPLGGVRLLTGPLGALAYDLEGLDPAQFGAPEVPTPPASASDQSAVELLEHYWAALLRDVPFGAYDANPIAIAAAAELTGIPSYVGPRNGSGHVTPSLLFRGEFPGETLGPHVSQFALKPASFGAQPLGQQQFTYVPNVDFGTSFADWLAVQNGNVVGVLQVDPVLRYRRNGRDFAAWTRSDPVYQVYLVAALVLGSINAPLNPGNPYVHSRTQNGFNTFGGPDIQVMLAEVSARALNAAWYQKWFVHLRARPEQAGGLIHLIKTGQGSKTHCRFSNVIMNSQGLEQSHDKYGTWLLSQAYPEASPTHPSYPTGHGVVAGAAITVLKFYYDGNFVIPNPVVPSDDGLSLVSYTGPDANQLTVNGELNKLGHNVSFAHGIHAGIHWRSDTDSSLLLGEALALRILQNKARTYSEPFTVKLTKFDGRIATISNR